MNILLFQSESTQKIYENYLKRVGKMIAILSKEDREELLLEIKSHIYEGMQRDKTEDKVATLLKLLDDLGEPEDFLKPMIAERKLLEATRSYNPKHIFLALKLNLQNGSKFILFAFLYLLLFTFITLPITKVIFPNQTGLFYKNNVFFGFGFIDDVAGTEELLGFWLIPICVIIGLFLFIIVTQLLRKAS